MSRSGRNEARQRTNLHAVAGLGTLLCTLLLAGCGLRESSVSAGTATAVASVAPAESTLPTRPPDDTPTLRPDSTLTAQLTADTSAEARAYLDRALELIEQHSINRAEVDWIRLRSRAYARAGNASGPSDTYPAIEFALRSLGDGHSFFLTPDQVAELEGGTLRPNNPDPSRKLLENGLAYLAVPSFAGSIEAGKTYARTLQGIIAELDATTPCGWIVDLRDNGGGDFWPMLAGIGPVLGEGPAGAFVTPGGQQTRWAYAGGQALEGDMVQIDLDETTVYPPLDPLPPVAVLIGRGTASSGEALLVSFQGRAGARSFGQETAGLSTGNERIPLSDGANLYLTVSRFADRSGEVYGGILSPDEYVAGADSNPELALAAATRWLLQQPGCAGSR